MALLAAFALIFLCAAPVVILYSKGYIFDMEQRRFVQTGALFLKTVPQDVVLKIGPTIKTISQQGILYNGIFVRNLVPKTYRVEVTSVQNPQVSWKKDLAVQPLVVTKETRIALPVPSLNPTPAAFATSTPVFQEADAGSGALYSLDNKRIMRLDLVSGNQTVLADLPGTGQARDPIVSVMPSANGDQAVVKTKSRTLFWFHGSFLDARTYLATFMKNERASFSELSFRWHPSQDQTLAILAPSAGYLLDTQANTYRAFGTGKIIGLDQNGSGSYYVSADGSVMQSGEQNPKPVVSLAQWNNAKGFWNLYEIPDNRLLAYQENGALVLLDLQSRSAALLGSRVTAMRISQDQNRVAYADGSAVLVTFLRDVFDDVRYAKGQTIRLSEEPGQIKNLFFANETWYVAAIEQDQIAIMEIDTRTPLNVWRMPIPKDATAPYVENASVYWTFGGTRFTGDLFAN